MILTEYIEQKVTQKNLYHFTTLGYECKNKDIIRIKPEHLTLGSHQKIDVACDICGKINKVVYKDLKRMLDKHGYFSCAGKCSSNKIEKTKLEKYGVTNNSKLLSWKERINDIWENKTEEEIKEIKSKAKETYQKKTGYENPSQNPEVKDKFKQTCLERYGVENPSYNEDIKEKRVQTKLKKFGVINNSQTQEWKQKNKEFWESLTKNDKEERLSKSRATSLRIYGYISPAQSPIIKEKIKLSNLQKYGVESHNQNPKIHKKQQISSFKRHLYKESKLTYQGTYELDFLNKYFEKLQISEIDSIEYIFNEKKCYYYPDFYLPNFNTIVEVKSSYYYNLELEKNLVKKEASIKKGYNFIFIIDKDYSEFEKLIKVYHDVA